MSTYSTSFLSSSDDILKHFADLLTAQEEDVLDKLKKFLGLFGYMVRSLTCTVFSLQRENLRLP
jgi:hypothetical protein